MGITTVTRGTMSGYALGIGSRIQGCYTVVGAAGGQQFICWTVPPGVNAISFVLVGGGGNSAPCLGGGGGGGLVAISNFRVLCNTTIRLCVGGAGGSCAPYNGYASTLYYPTTNAYFSANGGNGGTSTCGGAGGGIFICRGLSVFCNAYYGKGGQGGNSPLSIPVYVSLIGGGCSGVFNPIGSGAGGTGGKVIQTVTNIPYGATAAISIGNGSPTPGVKGGNSTISFCGKTVSSGNGSPGAIINLPGYPGKIRCYTGTGVGSTGGHGGSCSPFFDSGWSAGGPGAGAGGHYLANPASPGYTAGAGGNGTDGTGGGGGGNGYNNFPPGYNGGGIGSGASGSVLVSYKSCFQLASGGCVTKKCGYYVHTFLNNACINFIPGSRNYASGGGGAGGYGPGTVLAIGCNVSLQIALVGGGGSGSSTFGPNQYGGGGGGGGGVTLNTHTTAIKGGSYTVTVAGAGGTTSFSGPSIVTLCAKGGCSGSSIGYGGAAGNVNIDNSNTVHGTVVAKCGKYTGAGGSGAGGNGSPGCGPGGFAQAGYGVGGSGYAIPSNYGPIGTVSGGGGGGTGFCSGVTPIGSGGGPGAGSGGHTTSCLPQTSQIRGGNATAYGSGGGGAGGVNPKSPTCSGIGGTGGAGIAVISYSGTPVATGGTITTGSGYTYHTFTTSGTLTFPATSPISPFVSFGGNGGNSPCSAGTTGTGGYGAAGGGNAACVTCIGGGGVGILLTGSCGTSNGGNGSFGTNGTKCGGGLYGGGAAGNGANKAGPGVIRIIWPGYIRKYPFNSK